MYKNSIAQSQMCTLVISNYVFIIKSEGLNRIAEIG